MFVNQILQTYFHDFSKNRFPAHVRPNYFLETHKCCFLKKKLYISYFFYHAKNNNKRLSITVEKTSGKTVTLSLSFINTTSFVRFNAHKIS